MKSEAQEDPQVTPHPVQPQSSTASASSPPGPTGLPPTAIQPPTLKTVQDLPPQERARLLLHSRTAEGSWDEDSAVSQTSSTSGYRESYSMQCTMDSPKAGPPLASPDLHDLPSTSSATTNNYLVCDNSSTDCSFNENGERTALLSRTERTNSQHSLLMVFDTQDETTLI